MENQWVKKDGDVYTAGLKKSVVKEIGEIVNIELPELQKQVKRDEQIAIVESMKSALEIYSLFDGKIIEINQELKKNISLINEDSENQGWIYKIKITNEKT